MQQAARGAGRLGLCLGAAYLGQVVRPRPQPDLLANALRKAGRGEGEVYGWAAAEFGSMQALRAFLRDECGLDRDHLYVSSYWKYGEDDDGHRQAKQADGVLAG